MSGVSKHSVHNLVDLHPPVYVFGDTLNKHLNTEFGGDAKAQLVSKGETIAYSNFFNVSMTPIAPVIAQSSTTEAYLASNQALQQPTKPAVTAKVTGNAYEA